MTKRIFDLITQDNEVTWKSILLDLMKTGQLNPWDIDISLLARMYIEKIKEMKELNLFVSGKMLLASALLLNIKSEKLLTEGIADLDKIMFPLPEELEEFDDFVHEKQLRLDVKPVLTIKNPQARKRRVNIEDLMSALDKALEINRRRIIRRGEREKVPDDLIVPKKKIDISQLMKNVYSKIKIWFSKNNSLSFSELVPDGTRESKLYTFIPLLHLDNQNKVDLSQEEHFGEINIRVVS